MLNHTDTNTQIDEPDYSNGFKLDDFTNYCCKQIKKSLEDHKEFFAFTDLMYDAWRDVKKIKIFPWENCANGSTAIIPTTVDGIVPRIIEGCLDFDEPLQVKAHNETSDTFSDTIRAFVNWDLDTHPELYKNIWLAAQDAAWSGTGFIKNYFFKQRHTTTQYIRAFVVDGGVAEDPGSGDPLEVDPHNVEILTNAGTQFTIKRVKMKKFPWKKYGPEAKVLGIKDV